jgi:hypothetical protein
MWKIGCADRSEINLWMGGEFMMQKGWPADETMSPLWRVEDHGGHKVAADIR